MLQNYTETLVICPSPKENVHEVHFNRGVAGSQAYAREFNNQRPDRMEADLQKKAFKWLSKGLEEALLRFVKQAKDNTCQLRCCFYEFEFAVVLEALKAAAATGADVKIIYAATAEKYLAYWNLLKNDPDNAATRAGSLTIQPDVDPIKEDLSVFFSPRSKTKLLDVLADMIGKSEQLVCGMFPFSLRRTLYTLNMLS